MIVDGFEFSFPSDWVTTGYDTWRYFRKQFQGVLHGQKAVDVLALGGDGTLWCVELKDYRGRRRVKAIELPDEVAWKVRDTLAGIVAASVNATDEEQQTARLFLRTGKIRVALQIEQPLRHSRLFPRVINPVGVEQKLRKLIRPIDPHPVVTEGPRQSLRVEWTVRPLPMART